MEEKWADEWDERVRNESLMWTHSGYHSWCYGDATLFF